MNMEIAPEITENQRLYIQQRESPSKCKFCPEEIIFVKVYPNMTRPVEKLKRIYGAEDTATKVVDEYGNVSTSGRRFGWKLHECLQSKSVASDFTD